MSKDPIGFGGQGKNLYEYASGDPINYFDPNGEVGIGTAVTGIAVVVGGYQLYNFLDKAGNDLNVVMDVRNQRQLLLDSISDGSCPTNVTQQSVQDATLQFLHGVADTTAAGGTLPGTLGGGSLPGTATPRVSPALP